MLPCKYRPSNACRSYLQRPMHETLQRYTCAAYKQAADDFCPQQQSTTDLYHESCWGVVSSALAAKLEILTYRMLLAF